jgi:4'-phosphopantetheinyl transferase
MPTILYTYINQEWETSRWQQYIRRLPTAMQQRIVRYQRWQDRQLMVGGKMLLTEALMQLPLEEQYTLQDIQYTQYDRPYISTSFDFNISHSGVLVGCAIGINTRLGIDIQQETNVELEEFQSQFTDLEWSMIHGSEHPLKTFYKLWARKDWDWPGIAP